MSKKLIVQGENGTTQNVPFVGAGKYDSVIPGYTRDPTAFGDQYYYGGKRGEGGSATAQKANNVAQSGQGAGQGGSRTNYASVQPTSNYTSVQPTSNYASAQTTSNYASVQPKSNFASVPRYDYISANRVKPSESSTGGKYIYGYDNVKPSKSSTGGNYNYSYDSVKPSGSSTGGKYGYMNVNRKPVSGTDVGTDYGGASTSRYNPEYSTSGSASGGGTDGVNFNARTVFKNSWNDEQPSGGMVDEMSGTEDEVAGSWSSIMFVIAGIVILGFIGFVGWGIYSALNPDEEEEEEKNKGGEKEKEEDKSVKRLCMYDNRNEEHCLTNLHALKVLNGDEPLHVYMPLNETGANSHHTREERDMRTQIDQYDTKFRVLAQDLSELRGHISELNDEVYRLK